MRTPGLFQAFRLSLPAFSPIFSPNSMAMAKSIKEAGQPLESWLKRINTQKYKPLIPLSLILYHHNNKGANTEG